MSLKNLWRQKKNNLLQPDSIKQVLISAYVQKTPALSERMKQAFFVHYCQKDHIIKTNNSKAGLL